MAKVFTSTVLPAPAAEVWRIVRDFNALPVWTGFVRDSRIEGNQPADQIGCIRNFHLNDGGLIRERLLALSDYDLSCSYEIIESPMPLTNYIATLQLSPITDGNRTFASWEAGFDCAPAQEHGLVHQIGVTVFQAAFDALKQRLGSR